MCLQHSPRKRFGQNFLKDSHITSKIIESASLAANDIVIEIGPGLGALTQELLNQLNHLYALEIDRDIVSKLKNRFNPKQLTLFCQDVLRFDFSQIKGAKKIIGNLPYNISTPLLFHLTNYSDQIKAMYFMLQKEVADRLLAIPSTSNYSRLSVLIQNEFIVEHLFNVPPTAFWPIPKVESTFVRMTPSLNSHGIVDNKVFFKKLVMTSFNQRRKTLKNATRDLINENEFKKLGIDPNLRAENLSVEQFISLSNQHTLEEVKSFDK